MFLRKTLAAAAAVTAAAGGLSVAAAPVAHAAGGTAPACIMRYVHGADDGSLKVHLTNYCQRTMRVQVVIASGTDSPCYVMPDRSVKVYTYWGLGSYERTAVC
ncbi:beta-Ig-H3/fasciclin [Streptomyces sp. NPDC018693]|uniref:beta-Ig-H3/fasciclin n=1 Tax=unclassified Streptomyces TaxID=2593676 RepID=UPI0037920F54